MKSKLATTGIPVHWFGHINNNQTFTTKPAKITENATTVEDLKK
jgi:hypothetical protein